MINLAQELEDILKSDPLGLLDEKPKSSSTMTTDERLVASFQEINGFIEKHNREPEESRDISERRLYSRLKSLRESPERAATLRDYDIFNLLGDIVIPEQKEIKTIDDVLDNDVLGLLDNSEVPDIFRLKNVSKSIKMPEQIARRRPCKEFDKFEPLFKQVHADLATKKRLLLKFEGESQIKPGEFFVTQGMLVYVAARGQWEERSHGNKNARLHCVFENGTESDMLLRSLAAALWIDGNSRHVTDPNQLQLSQEHSRITNEDKATGFIYVLRSLSNDPQIKGMKNLYKIGYSNQPVVHRIQNAAKEPTYLMADVSLVTQFETYNLNPQKMELLLHTFFAKVCLDIDLFDYSGRRYTPREWFVVPLGIIETAVGLLISGDIVNYRYDHRHQQIVEK